MGRIKLPLSYEEAMAAIRFKHFNKFIGAQVKGPLWLRRFDHYVNHESPVLIYRDRCSGVDYSLVVYWPKDEIELWHMENNMIAAVNLVTPLLNHYGHPAIEQQAGHLWLGPMPLVDCLMLKRGGQVAGTNLKRAATLDDAIERKVKEITKHSNWQEQLTPQRVAYVTATLVKNKTT